MCVGMESGWHEIAAFRSGGVLPVAPRFSVYLIEQALERPRETVDLAAPVRPARCDGDVFEPSERALREIAERRPAARAETVTRVRVQLTSPAGRFLDLLI